MYDIHWIHYKIYKHYRCSMMYYRNLGIFSWCPSSFVHEGRRDELLVALDDAVPLFALPDVSDDRVSHGGHGMPRAVKKMQKKISSTMDDRTNVEFGRILGFHRQLRVRHLDTPWKNLEVLPRFCQWWWLTAENVCVLPTNMEDCL